MKRLLVMPLAIMSLLPGCGDDGAATSSGSVDVIVTSDSSPASPGEDAAVADAEGEDVAPADDSGPASDAASVDVAGWDAAAQEPDAAKPSGPTPEQIADLAKSVEVFRRDRLLDIHIEMDPADWDELRKQTRTFLDVLGPGCLDGPPVSPFTYFEADVTIDGVTVSNVGVRKKGFLGSMSEDKPALKVKFGEYENNQRWEGMRRLTLNNSVQDPALVRQCISYDVFARAGLPSPRCNFAMVTVNGAYLGPYVNVESLKKPFLRQAFGSDDGLLWEGTLSDFREGWNKTFQPKKTEHPDPTNAALVAVELALESPDDELEAALDEVMVLDEFFTFWATEVLTTHWDGYSGNTNNFYLYTDPAYDGRLRFIPWGVDGTLRHADPESPYPRAVMITGVIANRLYQYAPTRARYFQRLEETLDAVWNEAEMIADIDAIVGTLDPAIDPPYTAPWIEQVYQVKQMIESRRADLQPEIDAGGVDWPAPLRGEICIQQVGDLEVTFDTTWGTLGSENPFETGSASAVGTIDDAPVAYVADGAIAGIPTEGPDEGRVILGAFYHLGEPGIAVVVFNMPPDLFYAPASHTLGEGVDSGLLLIDPETGEGQPFGYFVGATLELEAAEMGPGGAVKGKASGPVFRFGG